MSYVSITFILFVILTGIIYYIVPKKLQWCVLLLASLFFYIISAGTKTLFLIGAALIIYLSAIALEKIQADFDEVKKELERSERKLLKARTERKKKAITAASIIALLLMIAMTKYYNFLGGIIGNTISLALGSYQFTPIDILLPLGISYYTLMGISYIVDVHRGDAKAEHNPLMLLLYLSYFPHIVEGPFDRYDALSKQFRTPVYFDFDRAKSGSIRILWGIFKKMVIADRAGMIVNTIFGDVSSYDGRTYLLGIALYTLQIYAEFSGCMDIVCGVSKIYGIEIAENFKRPFFSKSINEFWRRWHITLGLWLKDYVFYPVSLSGHFKKINEFARKNIASKHFKKLIPSAYALFFVWFCNGLWHGASTKYIVYGLYYYTLMMLGQIVAPLSNRALSSLNIDRESKAYGRFEVARTWVIVGFGMLIFRAKSLTQAANMFTGIFTNFYSASSTLTIKGIDAPDYIVLIVGFAIMLAVSLMQERNINIQDCVNKQVLPVRWVAYLTLIYAIIIFGAYGGNFANTSFIYGEF